MIGICSIRCQYLSRIGFCTFETDLVLFILLGLVCESELERLPYVEIGHVGVIFRVVVDLTTELLLLLAGWDTSVGYVALDSSIGFAIVRNSLQERRTSGPRADIIGQYSSGIQFGILLTVLRQASSHRP